MNKEPTTIASVPTLIGEVLRSHYNVDPEPLFRQAGIDPAILSQSDARCRRADVMKLWEIAEAATGDPSIGLVVGLRVRTTSFHALGFSWLTSSTLLGALKRLVRYYRVIATLPLELKLAERPDCYELEIVYPDPRHPPTPNGLDSFVASIVAMSRTATDEHFHPLRLCLRHDDRGRPDEYVKAFACPVEFDSDKDALFFDKDSLEAQLPGKNDDTVRATDRVIEHYLESLDPHSVTTEVRKLLIDLLPRGEASQQIIASRLAKSVSTLQRQLREEGTSFREVQDDTRQQLAEDYVKDGQYSLSEIAFLLGFSDQSNFSRAFRRWNGRSPSEFVTDSRNKP